MFPLQIGLEILGSLGVFLFGMRVMSEALQKVAGGKLRVLLNRMTTNRFAGVFTGLLVTGVVQSSSATTVMVVSFVDAQLLTLAQAIGVIMGANIGTTLTGWLVALLGFKVKLTALALPIVGVGFGLTFMKGARWKQWGEVWLGFGLLFVGLGLLKSSVPEISSDQLGWLRSLAGSGIVAPLAFIAIGTLVTVVLQSSSATMTLTLTVTAAGWIEYEHAAAMILGENIGTTVTALLASVGASATARRAAAAHTAFNLFGVVWAVALMSSVVLPLVDFIVPGVPNSSHPAAVTAHLAMFHTLFNVTNTALLIPFVGWIERLVSEIVPDPRTGELPRFGKFISTPVVSTPELQLVQVREELRHMAGVARGMYDKAFSALLVDDPELERLVATVQADEERVDGLEFEINEVLALTGRVVSSGEAMREVADIAQTAHRIERIADHCERIVLIARANAEAGVSRIPAEAIDELRRIHGLVAESLDHMLETLAGGGSLAEAQRIEDEIDAVRDGVRQRFVDAMQKQERELVAGLRVLQALQYIEEIGDRCFGIVTKKRAA